MSDKSKHTDSDRSNTKTHIIARYRRYSWLLGHGMVFLLFLLMSFIVPPTTGVYTDAVTGQTLTETFRSPAQTGTYIMTAILFVTLLVHGLVLMWWHQRERALTRADESAYAFEQLQREVLRLRAEVQYLRADPYAVAGDDGELIVPPPEIPIDESPFYRDDAVYDAKRMQE